MSELTWQESLAQALSPSKADSLRTAVLGIGQELRGDDAAGVDVARRLAQALSERNPEDRVDPSGLSTAAAGRFLIVDAGPAPENCTGALRRFQPDLVLLVDAAEMGESPGAVRWLDPRDASGFSASTHSLPLQVLADYLQRELECRVALLGIQPVSCDFGEGLSPVVECAVEEIVERVNRRT